MGSREVHRIDGGKKVRIWLARRVKGWPFLAWIVLAILVLWGSRAGSRLDTFGGVVEYPKFNVAASQEGRIVRIAVEVGEGISLGEVLVELDSLETDIALAEIRERAERDASDVQRQYFETLSELNREIREHSLNRSTDETELEVLREESVRLEDLLERRLIDAETVSRNRMRLRVAETLVKQYPELIAELENEREDLLLMMESSLADNSPSRSRLEELLYEKKSALSLRANRNGLAVRVLKREGDVVRAGETIIELVEEESPVVRVFVPLSSQRSMTVGEEVVVLVSAESGTRVLGKVKSTSPTIVDLPDTSNPILSRTISGRMMLVELPGSSAWTEGQRLVVVMDTEEPSALRTFVANVFAKLTSGEGGR